MLRLLSNFERYNLDVLVSKITVSVDYLSQLKLRCLTGELRRLPLTFQKYDHSKLFSLLGRG